ncbi:MAG: glycosyl transferase [Bacteroidaceae bacterium]|nr:glycosyl transferase [Bacteroidaceae bacterium]
MKRHAYLIIAHNEPEVLETLLHMLDVEWNDIYLHIDKRSDWLRKKVEADVSLSRARLFILSNPIKVYWGHVTQIKVEILLLKEAAANGPYAYYHLLSGCDMPIKSPREIYDFFELHRGREFLGFWNSERDQSDAMRKARYYYVFNRYKERANRFQHILTTPLRNILLDIQKIIGVNRLRGTIRKGFNWFSITEDFCRYLLAHERDIWKIFRYTLCGDELFMQTFIWDSPFRENLFDTEDAQRGSMRAIDWQRGSPYVWRAEDVDYLIGSPYLFARKFSSVHMDAVEDVKNRVEADTF